LAGIVIGGIVVVVLIVVGAVALLKRRTDAPRHTVGANASVQGTATVLSNSDADITGSNPLGDEDGSGGGCQEVEQEVENETEQEGEQEGEQEVEKETEQEVEQDVEQEAEGVTEPKDDGQATTCMAIR
jgi:hypothetical protein